VSVIESAVRSSDRSRIRVSGPTGPETGAPIGRDGVPIGSTLTHWLNATAYRLDLHWHTDWTRRRTDWIYIDGPIGRVGTPVVR